MIALVQFAIRFRYFFMIGGAIALISGAWVHGFFKGKSYGQVKVITKIIQANAESRKGAIDVKKEEQSFDDIKLDAGLCGLHIVRGNSGC
ncbi:MAG: hypothetical protein JKX96_07735 [Acinetobacter sp.]|nr:hypothetical protein [Acinetobacter sp.]